MYIYIYNSNLASWYGGGISEFARLNQPIRSISEISSYFLGRDPGTLKSNIVSKKHPQLIWSDLRLSN